MLGILFLRQLIPADGVKEVVHKGKNGSKAEAMIHAALSSLLLRQARSRKRSQSGEEEEEEAEERNFRVPSTM